MAIAPITNTLTRNSNVAFTALRVKKDKQEQESGSSSSFMKAVPLATMLAMSPLTVANINAADRIDDGHNIELVESQGIDEVEQVQNVLKSKVFSDSNGSTKVTFVNSDNNKNNFEKVLITESWPANSRLNIKAGSATYEVKGITKYNYKIQADDGNNSSNMPFIRLSVAAQNGNEVAITDKKVCQFVANELASSNNNSNVSKNVINRNLRMSYDEDFTLQNVPNGNIISSSKGIANGVKNMGAVLLGTQQFDGDNGTYEAKYYSLQKDDRVQMITIKGPNFPHLWVVANFRNNASFENYGSGENTPQSYSYSQTVLLDEDLKKYSISDRSLTNILMSIYDNEIVDNCFEVKEQYNNYMVLPKGAIAPIHD